MLKALRQQAALHLGQAEVQRKPALRRTDDPRALLATDLPAIADAVAVQGFIHAMEQDGWCVWHENGWLYMDHTVPVPAAAPVKEYPGERGCCVRLLQAHAGAQAPQDMIRALVKAADMGLARVEWLCGQWHGEFAAGLREHRDLPGGLLPYLLAAMKEETL